MWPRTLEIATACWLAMSPYIFRGPAVTPAVWWTDMGCAAAIALLSGLSHVRETRRAHLLILAAVAWLIGFSWWTAGDPAAAPQQNCIVVGLLLSMLAIIPTDCLRPTVAWQKWNAERDAGSPAR